MSNQVGRDPQYEVFADDFVRQAWQVHYWLAPLQVTCEEIFRSGFLIERLLEPWPVPEAAALDPGRYEQLTTEPRGFMAFRLVPRRDGQAAPRRPVIG
jgi:hypothetical protein